MDLGSTHNDAKMLPGIGVLTGHAIKGHDFDDLKSRAGAATLHVGPLRNKSERAKKRESRLAAADFRVIAQVSFTWLERSKNEEVIWIAALNEDVVSFIEYIEVLAGK